MQVSLWDQAGSGAGTDVSTQADPMEGAKLRGRGINPLQPVT